MMDFKFKQTKNFNLGIELELIIVDESSYSLKSCREEIIANMNEDLHRYFKPEYLDSSIEVTSPICSSTNEIRTFFKKIFTELRNSAQKSKAKVLALGTHPFAKITDARPTVDERYKSLRKELQFVLDRFLIYGMHIHVGIPDKTAATNLYNHTMKYMPLFLAISTSSPFFESMNTGLHSYRTLIFENLPRGGIGEYLHSYENFIDACKYLHKHEFIKKFNDIWWDVRIRPDLGTVELRICDSINDIDRIVAIASLFLAFAKEFYDKTPQYVSKLLIEQNKWNAVRHSLNGFFIDNNEKTPIKTAIKNLLSECKAHLTEDDLKNIEKIIESKTLSEKQLDTFEKTDNLMEVTRLGEI